MSIIIRFIISASQWYDSGQRKVGPQRNDTTVRVVCRSLGKRSMWRLPEQLSEKERKRQFPSIENNYSQIIFGGQHRQRGHSQHTWAQSRARKWPLPITVNAIHPGRPAGFSHSAIRKPPGLAQRATCNGVVEFRNRAASLSGRSVTTGSAGKTVWFFWYRLLWLARTFGRPAAGCVTN